MLKVKPPDGYPPEEGQYNRVINKTIGFIGGGRVVRILLGGFKRGGQIFTEVVVSDVNTETLRTLKETFPEIRITSDNTQPAQQDVVFLALHPPVLGNVLREIKSCLKSHAMLISLAPKHTIAKLSESLGGFQRIVRMIPNAPSLVNEGYNPVACSKRLGESDKKELREMFSVLGECPEVEEEMLEAYAILTAMGPTYFWFQLHALQEIGKSFGLTRQEALEGVTAMARGAAVTMNKSGLSPEAVMDLIPVKPLADEEAQIKQIYRSKLEPLFKQLKG